MFPIVKPWTITVPLIALAMGLMIGDVAGLGAFISDRAATGTGNITSNCTEKVWFGQESNMEIHAQFDGREFLVQIFARMNN